MHHGAPVPSARAQSRLTGPFQGQSSEWPLTGDINANATSTKTTRSTNTQTQAQVHPRTCTRSRTRTISTHKPSPWHVTPMPPFSLCSPLPLLAIIPDPRSQLLPDPSLLPRRPLIITAQQASTSRISLITLFESGRYLLDQQLEQKSQLEELKEHHHSAVCTKSHPQALRSFVLCPLSLPRLLSLLTHPTINQTLIEK